jgi:hypothetical protein
MGKKFEDLPKEYQKVLILWNKGKTGLQISEELGITRSSVMGRIHRAKQYGIRVKGAPIRVDIVAPPPRKVKNRRIIREAKAQGVALPELPPVVRATKEQLKRFIGLMQLTPMSCRFILNDDPARAVFCGAPKEKGSYCGEHSALCYHKPVARVVKKKGFKWKTSSFVLGGTIPSDG